MSLRPLFELFAILFSTLESGLLWLLVASIPGLVAGLLRLYRGPSSAAYWTCALAAVLGMLFWLGMLMNLDNGDITSRVNNWYLLFLYYFLPVWLLIWGIVAITAFAYRKLVGLPPESDDDKSEDGSL